MPFLHGVGATVIKDHSRTMYKEPLKKQMFEK
jgi:hypothetical protein